MSESKAYVIKVVMGMLSPDSVCPICGSANSDSLKVVEHMNAEHRQVEGRWELVIAKRVSKGDTYHIAQLKRKETARYISRSRDLMDIEE